MVPVFSPALLVCVRLQKFHADIHPKTHFKDSFIYMSASGHIETRSVHTQRITQPEAQGCCQSTGCGLWFQQRSLGRVTCCWARKLREEGGGAGWEVAQTKEMKWNNKTCFSLEEEWWRLHSNPMAWRDVCALTCGVLCMWVTLCWSVTLCMKLYVFICLKCVYVSMQKSVCVCVWSSWWDHSSLVIIEEKAKWRIKSPFEFSGGDPRESAHGT